jgi:hypothetical protein
MVETPVPPEQGSFRLQWDGSDPEDLLKAGKYDWVADYAMQIVHSKTASAVSEVGIEIVLLGSLPERQQTKSLWDVSMAPDIGLEDSLTKYDPPTVWDALKFGALYPEEQRKASLIFPHEPWNGPNGPSYVLVLRTDATGARGLSYVARSGTQLATWWPRPLAALRKRRGGPPLTVVS